MHKHWLLLLIIGFLPQQPWVVKIHASERASIFTQTRTIGKTGVTITIPLSREATSLAAIAEEAFQEGLRAFRSPSSASGRDINPKDHKAAVVVDRMTETLKSRGLSHFMIRTKNIGRAVGRKGVEVWRLAVPEATGKPFCHVSFDSQGVATLYGKGPHSDIRTIIVVAKDAREALTLSTTALLAGRERAREILSQLTPEGVGAVLQGSDGKIVMVGEITAACLE